MTNTLITDGLVRRFEAESGVFADAAKTVPATDGQPVAVWADQSGGAGNDLTQTNAGNQPTFHANQFSGKPGISFGLYNPILSGNVVPGNALTVFMVYRNTTASTPSGNDLSMLINGGENVGGFRLSRIGASYAFVNYGVAQSFGGTPNTAANLAVLTDSSSAPGPYFAVNGNAIVFGQQTEMIGLGGQPLSLGGGADDVYGALFIYDRVLTPAEIAQNTAYLNAKYGVYNQTPAGSATTSTYPVTDASLWGSYSVPQGSPSCRQMNSKECQIAFNFTGSGLALNMLNASATGNPGEGLYALIDGYRYDVPVNASSSEYWQTIASGLYDGPHSCVIGVAWANYNTANAWQVDLANTFQVTGASPSLTLPAPRVWPTANAITFVGNSRTQSFGNSGAQGSTLSPNGYPYQVMQLLGATWSGVNEGTYSETVSAELVRFPSDVATLYNPANTRNVVVLLDAVNDLNITGNAAAVQQTVTQYVAALKAAGWHEIIVPTTAYDTTGGPYNVAAINSFDTWLKANYLQIGATSCPDLAAILQPSDYDADQLHLNDTGYGHIAAAIVAGINNQQSAPVQATPAVTDASVTADASAADAPVLTALASISAALAGMNTLLTQTGIKVAVLPAVPAGYGYSGLSGADLTAIASALEGIVIEPGETLPETLRLLRAILAGDSSVSGNTVTYARADGTTVALTVTVSAAAGSRTGSTAGTLS